nr:DnaB-like helicase C-terminal domain-containing protein [uncultured Pseudodesulfovibrio sp.]
MQDDFDALANEKIPPFDLIAEHAVLQGVLLRNSVFHEVADFLNQQSFYSRDNGNIFTAMETCYDNYEPINSHTVQNALEESNLNICLSNFLDPLIPDERALPPHDIVEYAKKVRDKATLRGLILLGNKIVNIACNSHAPLVALDEAEKEIFLIKQKSKQFKTSPATKVINSVFETITNKYEQRDELSGLKTEFEDLDSLLTGIQNGNLIVIAGRPGNCKRALALNILLKVVLSDIPAVCFSLDTHHDQIMEKLLAINAGVSLMKIRTGQLDDEDWEALYDSANRISNSSLFFDSTTALSPLEIASRIKHIKKEHGISLVVIDRMQLMKVKEKPIDNPELEAAEISHALKQLASELDIPIIVLSELDPEVDKRKYNQPELSDLLYYGAYEQAADAIILTYRDAKYYEGDESKTDGVDIYVAKNRNGPCGKAELLFHRSSLRIQNLGTLDPLFDG